MFTHHNAAVCCNWGGAASLLQVKLKTKRTNGKNNIENNFATFLIRNLPKPSPGGVPKRFAYKEPVLFFYKIPKEIFARLPIFSVKLLKKDFIPVVFLLIVFFFVFPAYR